MTPEAFQNRLSKIRLEVDRAINDVLPREVGNKAVELFRENFVKEQFFDGDRWAELKPKTVERKRQNKNRILFQSGDLARSFHIEPGKGSVVITSDLPYSRIHNEGLEGKAWGKHSFTMPKRQFMGDHPTVAGGIGEGGEGSFGRNIRL